MLKIVRKTEKIFEKTENCMTNKKYQMKTEKLVCVYFDV